MVELVDIPERRKQIPPQSSDLPAAFGFESNEENNFGSNIMPILNNFDNLIEMEMNIQF